MKFLRYVGVRRPGRKSKPHEKAHLHARSKPYLSAGALNEALALHSFIDDEVFLTKTGDLGMVLRLPGVDFERQDPAQLDSLARWFESGLRTFTEQHRIYQYLIKTSSPEIPCKSYDNEVVNQAIQSRVRHFRAKARSLYMVEVYVVITVQALKSVDGFSKRLEEFRQSPRSALQRIFSSTTSTAVLASELSAARNDLHNKVHAFVVSTEDVLHPEVLSKAESYRFFRRPLNYSPNKHRHHQLHSDDLLDYYAADCFLETHRGYIKPTKAGLSTNITAIGTSGNIYQFFLQEVSRDPSTDAPIDTSADRNLTRVPHVRVSVVLPAQQVEQIIASGPKYVDRSEYESTVLDYQQQLNAAQNEIRDTKTAAKRVIDQELSRIRTNYPAALQFNYQIALGVKWAAPEFNWTGRWEKLMKENSHVYNEEARFRSCGRSPRGD